MIFSKSRNYEFRSIFPSRASFDCGECPCLFPHRVVLRHGFAGFPFWMALVLLVPAGLCVAGLYYFSMGTSADLSERFFRRFRREQPKPEEISIVEENRNPQ